MLGGDSKKAAVMEAAPLNQLSLIRHLRDVPKLPGEKRDPYVFVLPLFTLGIAILLGVVPWFLSGGLENFIVTRPVLFFLAVVGVLLAACGLFKWHLNKEDASLLKIAALRRDGILLGRLGGPIRIYADSFFLEWPLITNIFSCQPHEKKSTTCICVQTIDQRGFIIELENAFALMEPTELISSVRKYAPHVKVTLPRTNILAKDDPRYTTIWLEYFAKSAERLRRGPLLPGDKLSNGAIEIVEKVASGGQATVYLARAVPQKSDSQNSLIPVLAQSAEANVAVKEFIFSIKDADGDSRDDITAFSRESEILASLDHDKIVRVFDAFVEDRRGYLVLERVLGVSLRTLVKESGGISLESALRYAIEACEVLVYLHGLNPPVMHLDISPDNLMLTKDGGIKLIDFTIAQRLGEAQTMGMAGKYAYMPPEQIKGKPSTKSDLYALGCTLWFMLGGHDPSSLEVTRLSQSDYSPIDDLISFATELDQAKRVASASEMKDLLVKVLSTLS